MADDTIGYVDRAPVESSHQRIDRQLKDAAALVPTGVSVLTCLESGSRDHREYLGITIGSLAFVTLYPPMVTVSLGVETNMAKRLMNAGEVTDLSISVLGYSQSGIADHFSGRRPLPHQIISSLMEQVPGVQAPLVKEAVLHVAASAVQWAQLGDHIIVYAQAYLLSGQNDAPEPPLTWWNRDYHSVAALEPSEHMDS